MVRVVREVVRMVVREVREEVDGSVSKILRQTGSSVLYTTVFSILSLHSLLWSKARPDLFLLSYYQVGGILKRRPGRQADVYRSVSARGKSPTLTERMPGAHSVLAGGHTRLSPSPPANQSTVSQSADQ